MNNSTDDVKQNNKEKNRERIKSYENVSTGSRTCVIWQRLGLREGIELLVRRKLLDCGYHGSMHV